MKLEPGWGASQSRDLYQIEQWGDGFFDVSEMGTVTVRVSDEYGNETHASIVELIRRIRNERPDFQMPVLFRFPGILRARIEEIHQAFISEIAQQNYQGSFRGVYPVKVNHEQQVVHEITRIGRDFHYGLEVGTKPELIAALAYFQDPEAILICNGYKDREFVDIALRAQQMGLQVILVIETGQELVIIQEAAAELGIEPILGVRVKLFTESSGIWKNSGGERSPFGLSLPQIVQLIDALKDAGQIHWLRMLHYHQGSQVPEIRDIRAAVYEAARIYVSLVNEGAPMGFIDCGGGLAIDYDGSNSNSPSSKNYTLREYCADLIEGIRQVTDQAGVPNPDIITESGRAIVAHYSVLVFNILDVSRTDPEAPPERPMDDPHHMLTNLSHLMNEFGKMPATECYNDARYYYEQIRSLFYHGVISMREKACADEIYWYVTRKAMRQLCDLDETVPEELQTLTSHMVDFYYGNFSIFQSLPDAWAVRQVFPIMPIHRLNEEPTRKAVISDITCDCDGLLDQFVAGASDSRQSHVLLHPLLNHQEYLLGVFLVGAYQETLGDLHNLLGGTSIVSVTLEGGELKHEIMELGDTISEVLSYLKYDSDELVERFENFAEQSTASGKLSFAQKESAMASYKKILTGYTYFGQLRNKSSK